MRQTTLLFLKDDVRLLLAMKKRGSGVGRWNGVGGKPNSGESIVQAAIRECQEEIGVTPIKLKEVARLNFFFPRHKKDNDQQMVVFVCSKWLGKPEETEEMAPRWFKINQLPYDKMWSDDRYWLPQVISGKFVTANFKFDDRDELLSHRVLTKSLPPPHIQ